jgi:2-dehydro-3-deoxyphosphooctonate aldolase (KDO 8-P synthase)|tara:strand:+ start:1251 stop:2069 length:819 start_codon:yes stop_codon:yes gene_type:complete
MKLSSIPNIKFLDSNNFFLIAGPCAIESEEMAFRIAEKTIEISERLEIPYIFKGSFKKANRSRLDSFTGIGDEVALKILRKIRDHFNIPVITDIHNENDAKLAAEYVDILQIPAFLVRQTDLLVAAAKTKKTINLKKGQFMSPESMQFAVNKIVNSGNENVMITDRGTMFGYQDLVVDFRGIPTMKSYATTVLDVTHSLQKPNQDSGVTGGIPDMIETIARAGVVNGVDGLFIETHHEPSKALSDGKNMIHLDNLDKLLSKLVAIRKTINSF